MKKLDRACLARIIMGGILGLVASVALVPYLTNARSPSLSVCLLCTALGAAAGVATLPFAAEAGFLWQYYVTAVFENGSEGHASPMAEVDLR